MGLYLVGIGNVLSRFDLMSQMSIQLNKIKTFVSKSMVNTSLKNIVVKHIFLKLRKHFIDLTWPVMKLLQE